ncbi:MAG: CotH kinase family protein [Clostridia bacterium]|nr:CotH kinase family protein [Clostridia bacterium]
MKKLIWLLALLVMLPCIALGAEDITPEKLLETGIPLVSLSLNEDGIDAMHSDPDHKTTCTGTVTITLPDGYTNAYGCNQPAETAYTLSYIRGRGNSTWKQDKKPYKFKLEKGANLLGMGKGKHWVLLANALDPTMMRNELTYRIAQQLGLPYTPKMVPVNLMMNGKYLGVYELGNQVRIAGNSIDLDEDDGACMLSLSVTGDINLPSQVSLCFESDVADDVKADTADFIRRLDEALMSGTWCDADGVHYSEYMDVTSAADYFLMQMVTKNSDGISGGNNYFYKTKDSKLFFGPCGISTTAPGVH